MTTLSNRELVHRVCDQLHDGLRPVVEKAMREKFGIKSGDWVRRAHESVSRRGAQPPAGADLQFLLRCVRYHWDAKFQQLGAAARSQVGLMSDARNGLLAHYDGGSADITPGQAVDVVTPAVRLLEALQQLGASAEAASTAASTLRELKFREAKELFGNALTPSANVGPVTSSTPGSSLVQTPSSPVTAPPTPATAVVAVPADTPVAAPAQPVVHRPEVGAAAAGPAGPAVARLPVQRRPQDGEEVRGDVPERAAVRPAASPLPYPWKEPSNVAKDAKYGCRLDGRIKLQFDLGEGDETLLTTDEHPDLVAMIRGVKEYFDEQPGGVFYINEYGHVLVKAAGQTWYAGAYHRLLEFEFEGRVISPRAEPGAVAGDPWRGPHVGINYTLTADGRDVYFKRQVRNGVLRRESLSSYTDPGPVVSIARPVRQQGGRLYINEARVLFTPVTSGRKVTYVYLGTVPADSWYPEPRIAS